MVQEAYALAESRLGDDRMGWLGGPETLKANAKV